MPKDAERWTLDELIDFETALASWDGRNAPRVGGVSRRAGMKKWMEAADRSDRDLGRRWLASLGLAAALLGLGAAVLGASTVWGTLDRESGGVHVIWFLAVALVFPWCVLFAGVLLWILRGRVSASGLSAAVVEWLSARLAGGRAREAVGRIRSGGELSKAAGWRLARIGQWIAVAFHCGAAAGLGAMVLFKRVGFYWETTTERAMEGFLSEAVRVLAFPWAWLNEEWVPDVAASESLRDWRADGLAWWPFLILTLLVWGAAPRALLALLAWWGERRALASLSFQSPHHRRLWREMTGVRRGDEPDGPVDGALVVALDGAEPSRDAIRPYLLQVLRMNPTAWERLGVLDADHEQASRDALEKAPAGIVLLAEGWSLVPRSVERALREVAGRAEGRRVVLLVANPDPEGRPREVGADQRREWERFMDERGGGVELVFFEEGRS